MPLKSESIDSKIVGVLNNAKVTAKGKIEAVVDGATGGLASKIVNNNVQYLKSKGYSNQEIANKLKITNIGLPLTTAKALINRAIKGDKANTGNGFVDTMEIGYTEDSVLGLPFRYNSISDPRYRVYNTTFMQDSNVLSIVPGNPGYRKNDKVIRSVVNGGTASGFFKNPFSKETDFISSFGVNDDADDADEQILKWLSTNQKNSDVVKNRDLRYYKVESAYDEFMKYLNTSLTALAVKMGITTSLSNFNDYIDTTFGKSNLKFYATKNTSVSESTSNDFGASAVAGLSGNISNIMKEAQFLLGYSSGEEVASNLLSEDYKKTVNKGVDGTSMLSSAKSAINELINGAKSASKGINMYYPEIWKDSSFSRAYHVEFNFVSPYGSPQAIFEYVYLPFLVLYTLASGKQNGLNGYGAPFIIKADMPGYFTTDCAVITNMSWTKGGTDGLFSVDRLPLSMTVSIDIKDLYPVVMQSASFKLLRCNTGMHGFIDNLAGLNAQRFTPIQDWIDGVKMRAAYLLGTDDRIYNKASNWMYRITHPSK